MHFFQDITLETLLRDYESFVTLFLTLFFGLVGYFVKRHYDLKSKKVEINLSIFQGQRIEAVNRFFRSYNAATAMWNQLPYYDVIEHKMTATELDKIVQPVMTDLRLSILELRLYFLPETHTVFLQIESDLDEIYQTIGRVRNDHRPDQTVIMKGSEFTSTMGKNFSKN